MYRIYDYEKKKWLGNEASITNSGKIRFVQRGFLGIPKIVEWPEGVYDFVVDYDTRMEDKNQNLIYENDILRVGNATGVVGWSNEIGGYVLYDFPNKTYYDLFPAICNRYGEIIGQLEEISDDTYTPTKTEHMFWSESTIGDWRDE